MKPIEFARSFVAARKNRRPPMTTTGLATTIAKAVEAWQNQRPEIERMPYVFDSLKLCDLARYVAECGQVLRVTAHSELYTTVQLTEKEAEGLREMGFQLYPER